jgi:hypothetical protein
MDANNKFKFEIVVGRITFEYISYHYPSEIEYDHDLGDEVTESSN